MIHPARFFEGLDHSFDVMAIHRAQIRYAHIFKEHARNDQLFDAVFGAADLFHQPGADYRNFQQSLRYLAFEFIVTHTGSQTTQIFGHATHVFRDGHVVIVQYNDKVLFQVRRVVECLIGHAACQRAISDHRNDRVILP